ncbi:hypothetical protein A3C37_01910 [Candidatus Peribacteria bacterium RIFCSPHIGHO2_02_FULL_53_20]|nr:MAG: hypothetical protein A3C37_01910 [Candidatus Peribacteria bacterium RIFCSPHIGHO2_02_FULL_53_20]OGJ73243.1 MAG: hypothetical protein A3G69_05710 [Candidatus Peribacteria bacterium RIFCSPLOWO2_12_FULL_53_10]
MKIPPRIALPIAFAIACAAGVLLLVWWQLRESAQILRAPASGSGMTLSDLAPSFVPTAAVDPRDRALLHLRQGDLFALKGDWAGAEKEYRASVDNDGGLPALRKLAQAQLQRRDIEGVQRTLKALRAAGARSEDLLLLESIVALRIGELVQARDILMNASDSPQKHYGIALLSIVEGNHPQAQQELQTVAAGWEPILRSYARSLQAAYDEFALFPESTEIHLTTLLSRALAQVHECELALPLLIAVIQTQGDYRDAWIVQGYCELTTERTDAAVASLENAYNLDPSKPEIQYFLARAYSARGERENAITFLEYSLQNGFEPQAEIHRAIAVEANLSGKTMLALEHFATLLTAPDAPIEDYNGYVKTAIAAGQKDDAYAKAQEAVTKFPDEALAFELHGLAAMELEKNEEARISFEKALEMDPYREGVKERLKVMGN